MEVAKDWWKEFFSGLAVEIWRSVVNEEQTRSEADFLEKVLEVPPGAEMLDVPCGGGRLSLEMAGRGYRMTGVEFSDAFFAEARAASAARSLDVTWVQRNMRELPWKGEFDAAFCFGNSFGYGDEKDNLKFLSQVAAALRPGARFVLESYCAELAARTFEQRSSFDAGGITMIEENEYDLAAGGVKTEYTFTSGNRKEVRRGWQRMYSFRELLLLMGKAGFEQIEGFSSLELHRLDLNSGRLIVLARRGGEKAG